MTVIYEDSTVQVIQTVTANGETVEYRAKAGSPSFNRSELEKKAVQALANNATFLAIATPTAAQNAAQAKALTRQVNALIRLQLADLADISDT